MKPRIRRKQGGATCSAAVNQLGFSSAIARATGGVSCAAKPKLMPTYRLSSIL